MRDLEVLEPGEVKICPFTGKKYDAVRKGEKF